MLRRYLFVTLGILATQSSLATVKVTSIASDVRNNKKLAFNAFLVEPGPREFDPKKDIHSGLKSKLPAEELKGAIVQGLFPLLSGFAESQSSSKALNPAFGPAASLETSVLASVTAVQMSLQSSISKLNSELTDEPVDLMLAYLPWEVEKTFYKPGRVQLSGNTIGSELVGKPYKFNERVEKNIERLQTEALARADSVKIYFLGFIANLVLQKDASKLNLQVVLGLNPNELPFTAEDKVNFSKIVIRNPEEPKYATVMLVNFSQDLADGRIAVPDSKVELGPFGGWDPSTRNTSFRIFDDQVMVSGDKLFLDKFGMEGVEIGLKCGHRHKAAPMLVGTVSDANFDNKTLKWLVKKAEGYHEVNFSLYDLEPSLVKQEISDLHLYVSLGLKIGPLKAVGGCMTADYLNQSFKDAGNLEIKNAIDQKVSGYVKDAQAKIFEKLLNSNKEVI